MNVSNRYSKPTMVNSLNGKIHPRTLKEFSQTHSAPVQCDKPGQRDKLQIGVRKCLKNK